MPFVQLSKISLAFGDRDILKNITVVLTCGTKAAVTGANGSGKSTLMKIIAGLTTADSGDISVEKNTVTAYLPQSGIIHKGRSLAEEAETAFSAGASLLNEMDRVGDKMAAEKDEKKLSLLAEEYHGLQTKLEESGWNNRKRLIEEVLFGLGFLPSDLKRSTEEFSGGWQMRIALAKILLQNADIIILDEPTNYLDIEARNWLEVWLKKFQGGFLLVSHDRYFLDQCVTEIYELFNGELKRYKGSYSEYEKTRQTEIGSLIKAYDRQQEEIAKTEDFIRKFRYNASKAALVQDRIRRLEKLEKIEIPEHLKKIHFSFPKAPHSGKIVLQASGIKKSYGTKTILQDLDLVIEKNERLVLAGRNGAGKSTLLRILANRDTDFSGTVKEGAGISAGYFSQDESETITGSQTIIELLEQTAPLDLIPKLYDMLAAFLFRGDDIHKPLSVLSGGEKSRLALLRLLLRPLNLLILDEPTNHLDLHSKDVLLDALKRFDGTLIFVSHDKGFISGLATRVLELRAPQNGNAPSAVRNFPGTYDYYLYRLEQEEKDGTGSSFTTSANKTEKKQAPLSYSEQKKIKAERRKLEKEEEKILAEIEAAEKQIEEKEALLASPEIYTDGEKSRALQKEIGELKTRTEALSEQWAEIAENLNKGLF